MEWLKIEGVSNALQSVQVKNLMALFGVGAMMAFVIAYVVAELSGNNEIHLFLISILFAVGLVGVLQVAWDVSNTEGGFREWVGPDDSNHKKVVKQVIQGYASLLLMIPIGLMLPTHALPSDELRISFLVVWAVFFTAVFYDVVKEGKAFDLMPWFKWISLAAIALLVIVAFDAAKGWGWF